MHSRVGRALAQAWQAKSVSVAKRQLERLAISLDNEHPGAAASVREGLEETLTLIGLGIDGALCQTLRTTNPIANLNGSVARYTRNVKRWRGGLMIQRWVSAALLEAEKQFRRVRGYKQMPTLIAQLDKRSPLPTREAAAWITRPWSPPRSARSSTASGTSPLPGHPRRNAGKSSDTYVSAW